MKISSNNLQAFAHAASKAKPIQARESAASAESSGTSIPVNTSPPASSAAEPAKSAGQGPKALPPGLERVLARLSETASGNPDAGQSTALASITRNIARYQEMQSIGDTPVTPTPATPVEPEAPAVDAASGEATT